MIVKRIFAAIIALQLVFIPVTAHADEVVANISEGELAPFSGTLFNPEASARMIVELEHASESCDLRISEAVDVLAARHTFELEVVQSSLATCSELCTARLSVRENHINFLNDELTKKKPANQVLYFIIGTALGAGLTLGSSYAYSNIVN